MHELIAEIMYDKLRNMPKYSSYRIGLVSKSIFSTISVEPFKDVNYEMEFRFHKDHISFLNWQINYNDSEVTFKVLCDLIDQYADTTYIYS